MDICNGYMHHWSDDSYAYGSYPCPGPESCSESKLPPKTVSTPPDPPDTPKPESGYNGPWDQLPKGAH